MVKSLLGDLIEIVGISDILPSCPRNFKQFQVMENCCIPVWKPEIEQILRITVNAEILETKIIQTLEAQSSEGQIVTGKKLQVRGKLVQKIEYVADDPLQSVHTAEFEKLFSNYIVLDNSLECETPLIVTPYIEDVYIRQIDKRQVFKNIMLLISAVPSASNLLNVKPGNEDNESLALKYKKLRCRQYKCKEKKFFTQFTAAEKIKIPDSKPDMEQIVSAIVDPEIISIKIINTGKGTSWEGQHLSGKKAVIELKLRQKILYTAHVRNQSIHGLENESYQSVYVVIPKLIEGTDPEVLLKNKLIQPKITVEDIYTVEMDKRSIFKNITLYLELCYIPGYEICYSHYNNCTCSNLSLMYEDGARNAQITHTEDEKYIKPLWSPNGQDIAYLSDNKGKSMLSMINLKSMSSRQLTFPDEFCSISSFCWANDGRKIIFSAVKDNRKEIYSIETVNLKWSKLTNGNGLIKSYKPKTSPEGSKIAYLRSASNISNLWVSDMNGFNSRQITDFGYIKDFDWLNNGREIVGISGKGNEADRLFSVDIDSLETKNLTGCDHIHLKRCIRVSPDNKYIAFIGIKNSSDCVSGMNDIYVYEFKSKSVINLTQNNYAAKISDFAWKIDSTRIYYASNEMGCYNIYSMSMDDFSKKQLTNSDASNMQLSYRPRIK